nr:uncharacterized protein LOC111421805 [Onthophagus taurus]
MRQGNPLKDKGNTVLITIVDIEDPNMEKGIQKRIKTRYPEIEYIEEDVGIIEQQYKIKTKGQIETIKKKIIKICYGQMEKDFFENLKSLKDDVKDDEWVACHTIKRKKPEDLRKLMECIFHGTKTKVAIYEKEDLNTAKRSSRMTYAFVVENKEKTFTETLKEVKEKLQREGIEEGIKTIKSTKDGKLLMITERDNMKAGKIREAIIKNSQDMKMKQLKDGDTETIHIRGMDALVDKQEIEKAIKDIVGETKNNLKMGELRPMRDETRAITIRIEKKSAEVLLRQKNIKIALTRCELEKRIEMQKCYRCWEFGHPGKSCSGPDRGRMCFRCGKEGHPAKSCPNEEYCPICKKSGHSTGSGRCNEFRKELNIRRKQERLRQKTNWESADRSNKETQFQRIVTKEEQKNGGDKDNAEEMQTGN